jgi:hypothetical protein
MSGSELFSDISASPAHVAEWQDQKLLLAERNTVQQAGRCMWERREKPTP